MSLLYYQEVFTSIQGEGIDAGRLCTFVRLYGCNMKCSYCDQPQKTSDNKRMSVQNMIKIVNSYHIPRVCITGGEPLLQWESVYPLVLELTSLDYLVSIETNGCNVIPEDNYNRKFKYIMDVKCPSSGIHKYNILTNLMNLQGKDEVVFVIKDKKDYNYALKVMREYSTPATYIFSPCFDENDNPMIGQRLIKWMLEDGLNNVKVSIQMHKILKVK